MGPSGRLVTIRRSGLDGAHFPLTLSSCLFGRDIECDIRIQLPVVSKQHCKIEIHQKEATLINFSSSNPTQLNGRAIAQPVRLQHGDVITIVDRSFRYEDASHQDGDRPAASVGRRHSQESLRPLSASGFSSDRAGEVPDSEVLEEKVPGRSRVRAKSLGGARRSLENHAGRRTPELAGERGRPPGTPRPEKGRTSLSPFQQLYESMKEELGGRAEKENVPGAPRGRSASLGSQGQPPAPGSAGPRRKSTGGSQRQAVPASAEQGHTPKERQGPGGHPVSCPRPGTPVAKSPGQPAPSPRPSSRKRRRSEALGADAGTGSPSPGPQKLPRKSQTPTKVEGARVPGDTPEKPLPKKQRRLSSSGVQSPSVLAPLLMQGLGETPQAPRAEKAAGHASPGSPGLGSTHVGSCKHPNKWAAGEQGKRRRVSFGGRLRPELFDENLPPNTPLKRGETPRRCRSLAPSVLKTIIKGRPQSPAQGVPPSDPRQEAADSPRQPVPVADTPKRTSRRSGQQPPRRVSLGRSRQGLLQMIHSKRRSGASEANLMVARSWADVVRLGAKKTQTRTAKHAPVRQPPRKQRRLQNTPKKPAVSIPDHVSTGHANSPCTITVGRAHLEKVREPARPQWMLNHLVSSHKAGFPEDLSGLAEMFQTPGRGASPRRNTRPARRSASGGLLAAKPPAPGSGEETVPAVLDTTAEANRGVQEPPMIGKSPRTPRTVTSTCRGPASDAGKLRLLQKTPEQNVGPAEGVSGSRRKSGTPRVKAQPHEDLPSLEELFRTPEQVKAIATSEDGPCSSAKPEPAGTPTASRRLKTPSRGMGETPAARTTPYTPGRAATTRGEPVGLEGVTGPQEAAGQDLGLAGGVTGSRRRSKTPTVKAQPLEDLPSLEELFRTPKQVKEAKSEDGPCSSAKPEPAGTPTASRRLKTPSWGVQEPSTARTTPHTPGRATPTCRGPSSDTGKLRFLQENTTPEHDLGPAEGVSGSRRKPGTPRVKAQSHEDLPSLEELFRTPKQVKEAKSEDGPCSTAKLEPAGTPTTSRRLKTPSRGVQEPSTARSAPHTPGRAAPTHGEPVGLEGVTGPQETAGQDLGLAGGVTGSRRRSKTPRVKAQPLEDLPSLEELFRTPKQVKEAKSENGPCSSAKPEPAGTPTASRRLKTPSRGVQEPSTARTTPHTPGRATPTCRGPASDVGKLRLLQETPEQDLGPAEGVSGSRRKPGAPRVKAQPHEDLPSLEELFRTPKQVKAIATSKDGPCSSAKPEPAGTSSTNKRPKTPSRCMQEPSAARSAPQTPGRAAPTHGEPVGLEGVTGPQEAAGQDLGPAAGITGSRRRSRTPRVKAQSHEDLPSLEELFRTPKQVKAIATSEDGPCSSAKPEPAGTPTASRRLKTPSRGVGETPAARTTPYTPGRAATTRGEPVGLEGVTGPQETAGQDLGPAAGITGNRRRSRTPRVKAQPLEDLPSLEELFRTPEQVKAATSENGPCSSAKPEPAGTPTASRRLKTPSRGVQEPSTARTTPHTPGRATPTCRGPSSDTGKLSFLQETPKQDLGPAEGVSGSRRKPGTPRAKAQPHEDLPSLEELFRTPKQVKAIATSEDGPCSSAKPEPAGTPTASRRLKTPSRGMGETPAARTTPYMPGRAATTRGEPVGLEGVTGPQEAAGQDLGPAEGVTGSRRRSKTPTVKAQPLEDLPSLEELFRTPEQVKAATSENGPCSSAKPEPAGTPTASRRLKTPSRGVQEPSTARSAPYTPGRATPTCRGPASDAGKLRLLQKTPEQNVGPAEGVSGSRRKPGTPRVKAQPHEDLPSLEELFRTPEQVKAIATSENGPCSSAKPEPAGTPTASRRLKTPSRGVQEPSAARSPPHTPGRAAPTHGEPVGLEGVMGPQEAAGQDLGPAAGITGNRRRLRTPRVKAQPLEDLAGLEELFRTPEHVKTATSEDGPFSSAKPEPTGTPSTSRRVKTPSQGVGEPLAARTTPHTPGRAAPIHTGPASAAGKVRFLQESPEQGLSRAEAVGRSRRKPGTPRVKAQPLEDLAGLRELFRSPEQAQEPVSAVNVAEDRREAPQPEPVVSSRVRRPRAAAGPEHPGEELPTRRRAPRTGPTAAAGAEGTEPPKEASKRRLEPTEKLTTTRSRKQPRAAQVKVEAPEGSAELREPPQPDGHTQEPVSAAKTPGVPRAEPPAKPTVVTTRTRRVQAPAGPAHGDGEPPAGRRPTRAATRPDQADGEGGAAPSQRPSEQKPQPAERAAGSTRQPRAARAKVEAPGGPAGPREPPQPQNTDEPVSAAKTPGAARADPPAKPTVVTTRTRRVQAPAGPTPGAVEPPAGRRPTRAAAGRATRLDQADGEEGATADPGPAGQKPQPAEGAAGSRRQLRAARVKVEALEVPAEQREPPQPQNTDEPVSAAKTPRVARADPPAKPTVVTTRTRRVQAPAGPEHGDVELPAGRRPTRAATGRATRSDQADGEGSVEAPQEPAGQKPQPAEGATGSRRPLRAARAKAEAPEVPAESKEPPSPHEDAGVLSPEGRPSEAPPSAPQADSASPGNKRRRLRAAAGTAGSEEVPARPRASRAVRGAAKAPGDAAAASSQGTTEQKPDLGDPVSRSRRPLRAQARAPGEEAQPRVRFQLPQPAGVQAPEQTALSTRRRPARTPRSGPQGPLGAPVEEPESSGDPGASPSQGPALPAPPAGRGTRGKRQRPDPAAEEPPVQKRQRVAPPDPPVTAQSQRVRARRTEPVEEQPDGTGQEQADGTRAGRAGTTRQIPQGRPLRSQRPKEAEAEVPAPESPGPAEKAKARRDRRSPLGATQDPEPPLLQEAAPTDTRGPDSKAAPRPARGKKAPLPRAAEESPAGAPGKAALRTSRKAMVPVQQDTAGPDSKPRVTRGSKRGSDDAEKENDNVDAKKLRLRSRRERAAV